MEKKVLPMTNLEDALRKFADFNKLGKLAIVEITYDEEDFRAIPAFRQGGYRQRAHYTRFRKH